MSSFLDVTTIFSTHLPRHHETEVDSAMRSSAVGYASGNSRLGAAFVRTGAFLNGYDFKEGYECLLRDEVER